MKIYVSGPMTGIPEFNYPAFEKAAADLRALGFEVVSPHEINPPSVGDHPWEWFMKRDIAALVECDAIVALPGHETSRGATLEREVGLALGLEFMEIEYLVPQEDAA